MIRSASLIAFAIGPLLRLYYSGSCSVPYSVDTPALGGALVLFSYSALAHLCL